MQFTVTLSLKYTILLGLMLSTSSPFAQVPNESSTEPPDRRTVRVILDDLKSPLARGPQRNRAAAKLRDLGTNVLPLLMEELKAIGRIEATNVSAAADRKLKLQAAFQVVGAEAKPLLPELIAEFQAGQSLGNTPHAIAQIGGAEAGLVLVRALTNADLRIRMSAASALHWLKDNRDIASSAVAPLLVMLKDNSGPARSIAANTLGILRAEPVIVVSALLQTAETDPDSVVRGVALKSVGRFETNATSAQPTLQKIANSDPDEHVRKMALQALLAIRGDQ